jgi:hypothetical protein
MVFRRWLYGSDQNKSRAKWLTNCYIRPSAVSLVDALYSRRLFVSTNNYIKIRIEIV